MTGIPKLNSDDILYLSSFSEFLKGALKITKELGEDLIEISVKEKQAQVYAQEYKEKDITLYLRLQLAYQKGWEDCKEYIKKSKED